jgi:ribonuclease BN (tRNA processing enzyme)
MACDVARSAGARRLALFHFDPTYDDAQVTAIERHAQSIFPSTFAAREEMTVRVYNAKIPLSGGLHVHNGPL